MINEDIAIEDVPVERIDNIPPLELPRAESLSPPLIAYDPAINNLEDRIRQVEQRVQRIDLMGYRIENLETSLNAAYREIHFLRDLVNVALQEAGTARTESERIALAVGINPRPDTPRPRPLSL